MMNEEVFSKVLDNDEKVLEVFKPNKKRFVGLSILRSAITTVFILIFPAVFLLISIFGANTSGQCEINGVPQPPEKCQDAFGKVTIIPCIIAGLILLSFIFVVVSKFVIYKKTFYCCTNKRIIIRGGFIGVDYQTLDYDLIGGMDVRVDFFDKIIKPNTGTISFGSAASPMLQKGSNYYFAYIESPYETYKRIKEYSSAYRDGKMNS